MTTLKVIEVKKGDKRIGGVGRINYEKGEIYVRKDLPKVKKKTTIHHEVAHFMVRKIGAEKLNKETLKELVRSKIYKDLKSEGYKKQKIPEEIFAEIYGATKSKEVPASEFKKLFAKKYPKTYKKFSHLMKTQTPPKLIYEKEKQELKKKIRKKVKKRNPPTLTPQFKLPKVVYKY